MDYDKAKRMTFPIALEYDYGPLPEIKNVIAHALNVLAAGRYVIPASVKVSSAATLTLTTPYDTYVFTGTTGTWTLFPLASNKGKHLTVYNNGSGTLTLQRASTDLIHLTNTHVTSVALDKGHGVQLVNDESFWLVLNELSLNG